MQIQSLDSRLLAGRVSGVFGVRGYVRVFSEMDPRDAIADYPELLARAPGGEWKPIRVAEGRPHGPGVVLRFDGVETREQAFALIGTELAIERDWLPTLDDGWYWVDLVGLDVINLEGVALGVVSTMFQTGANDVMVVRGAEERLIPWVRDRYVKSVDLETRRIVVDWQSDW